MKSTMEVTNVSAGGGGSSSGVTVNLYATLEARLGNAAVVSVEYFCPLADAPRVGDEFTVEITTTDPS